MRHSTQSNRILALLIGARGGWVSLREILALGVARYGARIGELRKLGFNIQNEPVTVDGKKFSRYRLVPNSSSSTTMPPSEGESSDRETPSGLPLFPTLAPQRMHRDDN